MIIQPLGNPQTGKTTISQPTQSFTKTGIIQPLAKPVKKVSTTISKPQPVATKQSFISPVPQSQLIINQQASKGPLDSVFSTLGKVKEKAGNLVDSIFGKKYVSPIPDRDIVKPSLISKATKTVSDLNKKLGPILFSNPITPMPTEYTDITGKLLPGVEPTAGKFVAGLIDDVLMALVPSGHVSLKAGRNILKEGLNIVKGIKTATAFTAFQGLLKVMKEEEITTTDLLVSGGIGFLLGAFEPQVMVGYPKTDIANAKNILKNYGFKSTEFKNPEILKDKFRTVVKELHPDKGGNAKEFSVFVDSYNKVTSAGIDSKWGLPDVTAWINKLWDKQGKTSDELYRQANATFKTFLEKIVGKGSKSMELAPKSVGDIVVNSNLENTELGKIMMKLSFQAEKQGKNLVISEIDKSIKGDNIAKTPEGTTIGVRIVDPTENVNKPPKEITAKPTPLPEKKAVGDKGGVTKPTTQGGVGEMGKLYHGSSIPINPDFNNPKGMAFTLNKSFADERGAINPNHVTLEYKLNPNAKILDAQKLPADILDKFNKGDESLAVKYARNNGFDAIDFRKTDTKIGTENEAEIRVVSPNAVIPVSQLPKAQGVVQQPVTDLAQEARKYKSAEEFVKAQPTYYRGATSNKLGGNNGRGTFLTTDPSYANIFAGKTGSVTEYKVDPSKLNTQKSVASLNEQVAKELWEFTDEVVEQPQNFRSEIEALKAKGINAIESYDGRQLLVLDDNLVKTKSQLTDIYNQATKQPLSEVAKPVTKEVRAELQKQTQAIIYESETQDQAVKAVENFVKDTLKSKSGKELKAIRAELSRQMFKLAGADSGNWKKDYALFQMARSNPEVSNLIEQIELGIDDIDNSSNPPKEMETKVSKEVDDFVNYLNAKGGEEGFINIPKLKKPDLEALRSVAKKLGTREEQIGEDAFWQQELFKAKRETNIRDITLEVQEKFAPEIMVNVLSKIPYIDKDAAVRISRSIQRLNFVKEKKRQQLLYKTASAIKGIENGKPVFGTKIQKVLDDGTIKEDWRYTPQEAKILWEKLTLKERKILRDYITPIENAKTIFSRELLKQKAGLEKGVEGYIHKFYEDKVGDRFKKIFFKFRKAGPTKTRTRVINPETGKVEELKGNVENFEKAVIKQMENVTNAEEYNKFIQTWQDLLTEPLDEKNPLKKGWVEVRGTLKTGIPTDKPRIFKTDEGYGIAPQVRRQTPLAIKEMYMKEMGDLSESFALTNAIKSVGRYWQGNVLIYPGTAATNAISGGIQYGTKIINDFYKEGVFGGNFKPFFYDIYSLVDAINPSTVEKLRPELIGAKVNIATQFGKPENIVDKAISIGLTPFGMVETYWKRVIADATLRSMGKKPEDILTNYETFKKVSKESDIYGYNYSNIPQMLEKWRGSMLGAWIYPFATYPYKYARFIDRYTTGAVGEIFKGNKKDGFARLLTVATIASLIYFWQHSKEEKVGEYVDEMKYPGEFDKTGRIKIGETDTKESYLRIVKYPWFNFMNVMQSGADVLKGQKEKGIKEISGIGQEFISEGPLMTVTDLLLGKTDKFSMYKEKSVMWGETVKSFIPAFRINESMSMLIDPEKTKQVTFQQAIERALYIKPTGEIRTGYNDKELQYNKEEEFLKFVAGVNIRSIDRKEYEQAKAQVIQNMVYRIEENENITPKSKQRGIDILKIFGVNKNQYEKYLEDRKNRMSASRKK